MNPAPTNARNTSQDDAFSKGAQMAVEGGTAAAGNRPQTIASRKEMDFNGSTLNPLRKGVRRKFLDHPENHPSIPKSNLSEFTQETITPTSGMSGSVARGGEQNSNL